MTLPAPTYDLVLVLDPQAEEGARAKIIADTRASIEGQGELLRHDEWGERPLAYPIERRTSGEYHLLQFHAGGAELLDGLDRTLRITDGLLRFRIVKLKPGVPEAPDMRGAAVAPAAAAAARPAESEDQPHDAAEPPAQEHPADEAPAAPEQAQPAPAEVAVGEPA
jgi:small subunit ribosomal protein S6